MSVTTKQNSFHGNAMKPKIGNVYNVNTSRIWASTLGTGRPSVIFLSGAGTVGLDYIEIQKRVVEDSVALIYDRLGIGFSSECYLPRSSEEVIEELHELLSVAVVPKPLILVGHSLGGLYARHYAKKYQDDVFGSVLLDPAHEDYDRFMPEELNRLRNVPTEENLRKKREVNKKTRSSPSLLVKVASSSLGSALLGLVPIVAKYQKIYFNLFSEELKDWPEDFKDQLIQAHASAKWLLSGSRESINAYELYEEIRNAGATPDKPTIILNSMQIDGFRRAVLGKETEDLINKEIDGKRKLYQEYLSVLTDGKLIDVDAGHVNMPFQNRDSVVSAILEMKSKFHNEKF